MEKEVTNLTLVHAQSIAVAIHKMWRMIVLFSIQVTCSLCSETVKRDTWTLHKNEHCPKRMVTCKYCELPLPALDIIEHEVPH
jgi:formate dehydrogenase maturation protein FdhE